MLDGRVQQTNITQNHSLNRPPSPIFEPDQKYNPSSYMDYDLPKQKRVLKMGVHTLILEIKFIMTLRGQLLVNTNSYSPSLQGKISITTHHRWGEQYKIEKRKKGEKSSK